MKQYWAKDGRYRSEEYIKSHKLGISKIVQKHREEGFYDKNSPWVKNLSNHAKQQWKQGIHARKWSRERKDKLSKSKKMQWASGIYDCMVGENHYNWRGGVSLEPYSMEWTQKLREQVRDRDKRQCILCHITEKVHKAEYRCTLPIHHINYNKKDQGIDNLVTLCISCHPKTNHNREKWERLFQTKTRGDSN